MYILTFRNKAGENVTLELSTMTAVELAIKSIRRTNEESDILLSHVNADGFGVIVTILLPGFTN